MEPAASEQGWIGWGTSPQLSLFDAREYDSLEHQMLKAIEQVSRDFGHHRVLVEPRQRPL